MAAKKTAAHKPVSKPSPRATTGASGARTSARSTQSGPARADLPRGPADAATARMEATQALVASMPYNPTKASEYGEPRGAPEVGATVSPADPAVTGSTLSEKMASKKVGTGEPNLGQNPGNLPLDRVRVDSSDRHLTTNQGVPVGDNQHSLKPILALGAGATLIENAGVNAVLPSGEPDPGVLLGESGAASEALPAFIDAVARHRHHERAMDPPEV